MVAPRWPVLPPAVVAIQRRRMPTDVVAGLRARLDLARLDDGAGADGVVGGLVDQDERAAVAVVGVGVGDDDRAGAQRHRADVVEHQLDWAVELVEGLRIQPGVQRLHGGPHGPGGLLQREPVAGPQRGVDEPAHRRVELAGQHRQHRVVGAADEHVAAARRRCRRPARSKPTAAQRQSCGRRRGCRPRSPSSGCRRAATPPGRRPAACPPTAVRCSGGAARRSAATPTAPAAAACAASGCGADSSTPSRYSSSVGPLVPRRALGAVHDVVAVLGGDRDHRQVGAAEAGRHLLQLGFDLGEPGLVEVDQVDLVDRRDEVLDAQQLCDPGVPAGLAQHPGAGVDEQDRDVGVGRAGEHVAGVALVAGGVGQDVAARARWRRTGRPRRW